MRFIFFLLLSSALLCRAQSAIEILDRCQGEGCDCYAEYRDAINTNKPTHFPIKTVRPFSLHESLNIQSKVLAKFSEGTLAKPLASKTLILQKGQYLVLKVKNKELGLRPNHKLDTLLSEGEGVRNARLLLPNGVTKQVYFDDDDVVLKVISKTKTESWVEIKVGALHGYAPYKPYSPFQGCLE